MRTPAEVIAAIVAIVVLVVLILQLFDVVQPNGTSIGLIVIFGLIGVALVSPEAVSDLADRIRTVKVGSVQVDMAALKRAERTEARTPPSDDDVKVSPRPRGGTPAAELTEVREKLKERLRFVRDALLELPEDVGYLTVVSHLHDEGLLEADERELIHDIFGGLEGEISDWAAPLRKEYLDATWRYAVRLGTTIFERIARRALEEAGWFIAGFEQSRDHRPDYLAFHGEECVQWAARVQPSKLGGTRQRLSRETAEPADRAVVIIPNSRKPKADGKYESVDVVRLEDFLEATASPPAADA